MTEDESRKMFEEWSMQFCGTPLDFRNVSESAFNGYDVLDAIQWATKVAREKCAQRCEDIGNALDPHKWPTPHRLAEILREEADD